MQRNKEYIANNLYIKDTKVYCKEKTVIEFPKWYADKGLATIEVNATFYGLFCIIVGDKYAVSTIPTICTSTPILIKEVVRGDVEYYQLVYGKGDCVISNTKLIRNELLSYTFIETYYMQARVPWFYNYEDLVKIMDNLPEYAKSAAGSNFIVNELITSFITRSAANKNKFYRQVLKGEYAYVDLMNVYYSALSTVSKLGGNRMNNAMVSAIVQPETKTTKLEDLVRK